MQDLMLLSSPELCSAHVEERITDVSDSSSVVTFSWFNDRNRPIIHSDLLCIIFEYLPNFFLLSPPMVAMWRKVFEVNHDYGMADQLIQQMVTERLLKKKIMAEMTSFELLTEIVGMEKSTGKYRRAQFKNPQVLVETLGLTCHVNEWACLFERLWVYCTCGEKYPQNVQKLSLDLKQLLMVNELVARFSHRIIKETIQESVSKIDSVEISLLYFEDKKCQFYQQSLVHKYLLNDEWNVDFSKTPIRVRGELIHRNNQLLFVPYLNWFSTPTESRRVTLRGCEGYLRLLKTKGELDSEFQEDFLQRYWFKACVGTSELFHSYSSQQHDYYYCEQLLNLITTKGGQLAHADGNINEFFATKLPKFFRHRPYGNTFSKCSITISPKDDHIKATIYPENYLSLITTIGGRVTISLLLRWYNWFFNWKYSNQFFDKNNFSIWGRMFFFGLDALTTFGYPLKAVYSFYHGCWLHQHITLLESFMFLSIVISYLDAFKYTYSFRFTPLTWEGSYLGKSG